MPPGPMPVCWLVPPAAWIVTPPAAAMPTAIATAATVFFAVHAGRAACSGAPRSGGRCSVMSATVAAQSVPNLCLAQA